VERTQHIALEGLPQVGRLGERLQSYNVEMVEIIGGRFWKPYGARNGAEVPDSRADTTPTGMDPSLYRYRPPIDLSNERLRKLAAALGPAYVRVSGTWANTVYFHDSDDPPPSRPPQGFGGVLTRDQWRGVIDFAASVGGELVTSVATGTGVRDRDGAWTSDQAQAVVDYTTEVGGRIAATEFMNEPTYAAMGGAPPGYDAAAYGRDVRIFRDFLARAAPGALFLGPGSVGEGGSLPVSLGGAELLSSEDLLAASGPVFDVFSYHFYGAVSERMRAAGPEAQTSADAALSAGWLSRTDLVHTYYAELRDRFLPGKPMWLTETAEAAAGGNPWAATFTDTFRYLYQLGSLARSGVQVIMHNTLASSDYGLLDEDTFSPRPNYWAALLGRSLMGNSVLDPGPSPSSDLHLFAHDLRGGSNGVALLVINGDQAESYTLEIDRAVKRYTLSAPRRSDRSVELNGQELALTAGGGLPQLAGARHPAGPLTVGPRTITFLTTAP
jgi:heparanase